MLSNLICIFFEKIILVIFLRMDFGEEIDVRDLEEGDRVIEVRGIEWFDLMYEVGFRGSCFMISVGKWLGFGYILEGVYVYFFRGGCGVF